MNAKRSVALAALAGLAVGLAPACTCGWLAAPFVPREPICVQAPYSNPPATFEASDLVGTWATEYHGGDDRLIINADGTFKQIYQERIAYVVRLYSHETPWNHWWLERLPDGRARVHLEGARYYHAGTRIAELEGMGFGPQPLPWLFHDPFGDDYLEMPGKLVLNVRVDSRGDLLLHHMFYGTDDGFSMTGCQKEHFRRIEGP